MIEKIYAHSIPGEPPDKWQSLENHLEKVAQIAGNFAQPFDGSIWAQLLGLSHDIGKGSLPWQAYLRHENEIFDDFAKYYIGRVEHSAHGAQGLYENSKESGKLMAYCVGGTTVDYRIGSTSRDLR